MKLNNWLEIWLDKYIKHMVKPVTYNRYKEIITQHINPVLGEIELSNLTAEILQDFVLEKLSQGNLKNGLGLSKNSVVGIFGVLKHSLKQANFLEIIDKEYTKFVKLPQIQEKEVTAFEKWEQKKIENYCLKHRKQNYLGIVICLYTGIRLGELLALKWDDINFEKKLLIINKNVNYLKQNGVRQIVVSTTKTKCSNRAIPIPKTLLFILRKAKKQSVSKYVISTKLNNMLNFRSYQRTFEKILLRLDIKPKNFHALRHTFATRALEMGIDIKSVAEVLGHKNPMITLNRYSHSLLAYKSDMMNKLGKMLVV